MKAIKITSVGSVEIVDDDFNNYNVLSDHVGGFIEYLYLSEGTHAYIDEEGKLKGLQPNPRATELFAHRLLPGDYIVGPMLLLGDDGEGSEADVPQEMIDHVKKVLGNACSW
jgi:hypothetical protein